MSKSEGEQPAPELQWQIDRYVLGDADMDRTAFEEFMLQDEQVAWWVAKSVQEHLNTARAAKRVPHSDAEHLQVAARQSNPSQERSSRRLFVSLLVTSAAIFLAVLWNSSGTPENHNVAPQNTFSQIADNWVALGEAELVQSSLETDPEWELVSFEPELGLGQNLESPLEDEEEDWMLQAASDFYAEFET